MIGSYYDDGYELAVREMVGELAIEFGSELNPTGVYIFPPHVETASEADDAEKLARLLYFVVRSDPLQRIVRESLVGVSNYHARLHIVIETLIKLTGRTLCQEMVVAANVLLHIAY